MRMTCINADDDIGTGTGLLTKGKVYMVTEADSGYYNVQCDDGKLYTKLRRRFSYDIPKAS
jgi:hypothetical protein